MADVILCTSTECPVRHSCYRAKASPQNLQTQRCQNFEYTCNEDNGFADYIQLTLKDLKKESKR